MPTVLVITEQERLRLLFTRMGESGGFRLRVAPTLGQGEEEIALRMPHYIFVESGISGMTGADIMCYLRVLLPEEVEVVLMARDDSGTEAFRGAGGLFCLDLSLGDEALQRGFREIILQRPPRQKSPPPPSEPLPVAEKTTRKLLFEPGRRDPAIKDKRLLWLIPLVLAVAVLSVFTYRLGRRTASTASQPVPGVAVPADNTSVGRSSAPNPASQQKTALQPAGTKGAAPAQTVQPSGTPAGTPSGRERRYQVQRGDTLLKILVKDFGLSYQDAMRTIPEVKRRNDLSDAKKLKLGQTLIIPARQNPGRPAKGD